MCYIVGVRRIIQGMELKERIRIYLRKRNEPVRRDDLIRIMTNAGVERNVAFDLIREIQDLFDPNDCDIGTWWGYRKNGIQEANEPKTLWLRLYPMKPEEKELMMVRLREF